MRPASLDLEDALQRVEALLDIQRLIYSYSQVLDFGSPDAYIDLFLEDAVVEIQSSFRNHLSVDAPIPYLEEGLASGGRRTEKGIAFQGHASLRQFAGGKSKTLRGMHVVSQPIIQLIGPESATAVSYMQVLVQAYGEGPQVTSFGRYLDRFTRTDSGWKIAERICEV